MAEGQRVDDSFNRRVKALARTAPVHDLEANKHAREGEWSAVDLRGLALAAVDEVIDHMGLEFGATSDMVRRRVAALARAALADADQRDTGTTDADPTTDQQPAADRIATAVLAALLNDGERREAFTIGYSDWTGPHRRALLTFKLLEEVEAPDGTIVLRATDDAINLFVGALDRDVEDAQAAAEAVLTSQLRRGRIDQAVVTAREARLRSVQYATRVRRILETTRRDVRQVDWGEDVPALLDDGIGHLAERLDVERHLLSSLRSTLDEVGDDGSAHHTDGDRQADAAELLRLVEDCQQRHVELHRELIGARAVFLDAQQHQRFAPAPDTRIVSLDEDVLKPLLAGAARDGESPAVAFLVASGGPRPAPQTRLADLVSALLQPRRAVAEPGTEVHVPDMVALDVTAGRYSDTARRVVGALLDGLSTPTRLSALLPAAREGHHEAAELLAVSSLHAFAGETGVGAQADADGTPLADEAFGGADLLLIPAGPSP